MAKKNDITRTSGLLRHVNKQTFGANATVEIGEAIDNPAFGRGGAHTGIEIARILVMPDPASPTFGGAAAGGYYQGQIQIGDQSGVPAVVDPQDEGLFAHLHHVSSVSAQGGNAHSYPKMMPIINVVPIIVEQYYTVVHQGANSAVYNSIAVFTIIDYYAVEVPDSVYTQIVLSRRDQS